MGLDFTNIPDREGAACYVLSHGTVRELAQFERIAQDIAKNCSHQMHILDVKTVNGEKVRDFYDIMPEQLPAILIIRDDDSLANLWVGTEIPSADIIAHALNQITASK